MLTCKYENKHVNLQIMYLKSIATEERLAWFTRDCIEVITQGAVTADQADFVLLGARHGRDHCLLGVVIRILKQKSHGMPDSSLDRYIMSVLKPLGTIQEMYILWWKKRPVAWGKTANWTNSEPPRLTESQQLGEWILRVRALKYPRVQTEKTIQHR